MWRVYLLALGIGCGARTVRIVAPIPVQPVKVLIDPPSWDCGVENPPTPPPPLSLNYDEEDDIVRRVFVHKLEFNDAVDWMFQVQSWMADLKACMEKHQ